MLRGMASWKGRDRSEAFTAAIVRISLMSEAARTFETPVNFNEIACLNIPEKIELLC
jgi:hypothetical protein